MKQIRTSLEMYKTVMKIFNENCDPENTEDIYDVDMFMHDIIHTLFTERNIDEDEYLEFQGALILLVRDDTLLLYYRCDGLVILHTDLMNYGERYYAMLTKKSSNKEIQYDYYSEEDSNDELVEIITQAHDKLVMFIREQLFEHNYPTDDTTVDDIAVEVANYTLHLNGRGTV